jgi:hypothetical protein
VESYDVPLLVLSPVLGLGVYCVAHVGLSRFQLGRPPYVPLIYGFGAGFVAVVVSTALAMRDSSIPATDGIAMTVLNGLTYAALGWCYFHFVNLGIASLRIRVLEEIADAGGGLPVVALRKRYDDARMTQVRIQRLLDGGHLVVRDGRFHSGVSRFLLTARLFAALRSLIIGVRSA